MKKVINKFSQIIIAFLLIPACNTTVPDQVSINQSESIESNSNRFSIELLIEQQKSSGELISIGSKGVQSVLLDTFDFPIQKLVQNELKIKIPSINSGKHQLAVSLYSLSDPLIVPLLIPDLKIEKVYILIRFSVDEENKKASKIIYGFDLDQNGIIDSNLNKFESLSENKYLQISSDGKRVEIDLNTSLDSQETIPNNKSLPPGIVPTANEITQSNIQDQPIIIEPPKPESTDISLYPLPPTSSNVGGNLPPSFPEFPTPQKSSVPE